MSADKEEPSEAGRVRRHCAGGRRAGSLSGGGGSRRDAAADSAPSRTCPPCSESESRSRPEHKASPSHPAKLESRGRGPLVRVTRPGARTRAARAFRSHVRCGDAKANPCAIISYNLFGYSLHIICCYLLLVFSYRRSDRHYFFAADFYLLLFAFHPNYHYTHYFNSINFIFFSINLI